MTVDIAGEPSLWNCRPRLWQWQSNAANEVATFHFIDVTFGATKNRDFQVEFGARFLAFPQIFDLEKFEIAHNSLNVRKIADINKCE